MLVDSHCHLDFGMFDQDRDAVLERARVAGVRYIINPGYNVASSRRAVRLAERHDEVYAAVGVHPHEAKTLGDEGLADLRQLAAHPKVVAIGEIGLDFYRDLSARDVQGQAFRAQLRLASETGLPVVVHSRDAHEEVMSILTEWTGEGRADAGTPASRGVLHAFSGDRRMADQAFEIGFSLGVAGPVTFRNAGGLRTVIGMSPLERMLLETDAPYLTPHPYRGRRNEPERVSLVANAVAELLGLATEVVARETSANACRLFDLPREHPDLNDSQGSPLLIEE